MTVIGTVTKVFKRTSGKGEFGAWSFQGFKVQDETGEIYCTLKGLKDELTVDHVGKAVVIESVNGDHGWHGVKVENEPFTDKNTGEKKDSYKVIITPSAKINFAGVPDLTKTVNVEGNGSVVQTGKTNGTSNGLRKNVGTEIMSTSEQIRRGNAGNMVAHMITAFMGQGVDLNNYQPVVQQMYLFCYDLISKPLEELK